jgi:hypothetical protein
MTILGGFWKRFIDLLPKSPRYIGTVTSVDGDGLHTIQLTGGGFITCLSNTTFQVADKVFVTDKKIEGKAPSLPTEIIEV